MKKYKTQCEALVESGAIILVCDGFTENGTPIYVTRKVTGCYGVKCGRDSMWEVSVDKAFRDGTTGVSYRAIKGANINGNISHEGVMNDMVRYDHITPERKLMIISDAESRLKMAGEDNGIYNSKAKPIEMFFNKQWRGTPNLPYLPFRVDYSFQTDCHSPQMETLLTPLFEACQQFLQQLPRGIAGKNRNQQSLVLEQYRRGICSLTRIFEVLPNESADYPDGLSTSSGSVEMEIARCISQCLEDAPVRKRGISYIQGLLRAYKVVRVVPGQNPTVSLQRVHTILQDNYKDSCLCGLMNILITGFYNTEPKVITF